jgi:hypothetical protein
MRYMLLYFGEMGENEEERATGMREMAEWYGRLGQALVDGGNPFVAARTIGNGVVREGTIGPMPTGYTIIVADDIAAATELAKGCPIAVVRDILMLETLPMP